MSDVAWITFDVFGTLLEYDPEWPWIKAYVEHVKRVRSGEAPYKPLSVLFDEVGADWRSLVPRPNLLSSLDRLHDRGYVIVPLSNADTPLAEAIVDHFGLPWGRIVPTELAQSFKPDPKVYAVALDFLGAKPPEVLHVASHPYDLRGARTAGFQTAYVAWPNYAVPVSPGTFDYEVTSLMELCDKMENPS